MLWVREYTQPLSYLTAVMKQNKGYPSENYSEDSDVMIPRNWYTLMNGTTVDGHRSVQSYPHFSRP